jgi:hypothetical protein
VKASEKPVHLGYPQRPEFVGRLRARYEIVLPSA